MIYRPTLDEVKRMAAEGRGNVVPVYRDVTADLETPVSAYLKVARGRYSFLLESVEGGERLARFSFIGTEPYRILRTGPSATPFGEVDPLPLIEDELARYRLVPVPGLPPFHGGAVGYLSYEVARYFEHLPVPEQDPVDVPEAIFLFSDSLLIFDHLRHSIKIVGHVRLDGDIEAAYRQATWRIDELALRLAGPLPAPNGNQTATSESRVSSNVGREGFLINVETAKQHIFKGDVIQVVPSQRLSRATTAHPFDVYRALRTVNPSPYMYYLELDDVHIVGASPEMLVRVEDGLVQTHPIAGTRPRGRNQAEDDALERELLDDEKERAEHTMLLDLGRNDVGRVSVPGSVRATQIMDVERYSHVMHLVSHVTGQLRPELTAFDALRACFPAGTVSGAPKIRAMEIIAELEPDRRGPYAGAVGYFGFSGNLDTAITIRTIVMKDGIAHVQAGGGIVFDSLPEAEYQESLNKAGALLKALDEAERAAESVPLGSLGY
jgi:anthranilate synthase component 1